MTHLLVSQPGGGGPAGYSYDGLFVRAERDALLALLQELRAAGWLGPQESEWVVLVAAAVDRPIARGRTLDDLGGEVARRLDTAALGVSCRGDRALALVAWAGETVLGRYVSTTAPPGLALRSPNPSEDEATSPADDRLAELAALGDPVALAALVSPVNDAAPVGAELGARLAELLGRDEAADGLESVLAAALEDEEIESERLVAVLDLLGLPRWLVAAPSLPRDVPGGPKATDFLRLGSRRRLPDSALASLVRRGPRRRR